MSSAVLNSVHLLTLCFMATQLAKLFIPAGQSAVCLLTMVEQIVTAAHSDL